MNLNVDGTAAETNCTSAIWPAGRSAIGSNLDLRFWLPDGLSRLVRRFTWKLLCLAVSSRKIEIEGEKREGETKRGVVGSL